MDHFRGPTGDPRAMRHVSRPGAASEHWAVASLCKSMGAASLHKSIGAASLHKSMGAAALHKSMAAAALHKSMGAAALHKSMGAAALHKSMGAASMQKSMGAASLYKSMAAASLHKSITSQWMLHPCTSQWVLHPYTSQWVLHPCTNQWVPQPSKSFRAVPVIRWAIFVVSRTGCLGRLGGWVRCHLPRCVVASSYEPRTDTWFTHTLRPTRSEWLQYVDSSPWPCDNAAPVCVVGHDVISTRGELQNRVYPLSYFNRG